MNPRPTSVELVNKWDRLTDHEKKYMGLMGMCEMEVAVAVMEKLAEKRGINIAQLGVTPNDFIQDCDKDEPYFTSMALSGFVQLVYNGWLAPSALVHNRYMPRRDLIRRLNERWGTDYPLPG